MNNSDIEKLYEEKRHDRVVSEFKPIASSSDDPHLLRLFLRSANSVGIKVFDCVSDKLMGDDTDYVFNRFMHDESYVKESSANLLKKIISDERNDLLEDFVLTYMEHEKRQPVFDELNDFIIHSRNKKILTDYLGMIDETNENLHFMIIKSMIFNKDCFEKVARRDEKGVLTASFECFLKGHELTGENFEKFASGARFIPGIFVLFENDLYRIEKFDREQSEFTIKDKFARKRTVKYSVIAEKTAPIKENDFRVYKYFKPEEAREIPPCSLVVMILKYRESALDRSQLKDELVYVFGKEASSYLTKNKKILEQCPEIEIIYEKPERYVLATEGNFVFNKVKKMKTIEQIRDYMMTALKNREISDEDGELIAEYVNSIKSAYKNELLYLITGKEIYAAQATMSDLENGVYIKFIFEALKIRLDSSEAGDKEIEIMEKLDPLHIERLFQSISPKSREKLLEAVHKSLRLSKNMKIIEWYLTHHLEEELFDMHEDYIMLRAIMISNDIYAMKKTDEFLNFMRRFFFDPKKERFIDVIKKTNDESGKRIFDEFMKILYLNDYQKDEIRKQVYSQRPEYRDYKPSEFLLSTHESIKRKQDEFADITENILKKLSKTIQEAAALGDLSENSEYKFAREQYRLFSVRAEELKKQLSIMEPIDMNGVTGDKVEPGTIVTVLNKAESREKTYKVLGVFDVDVDRDIISYLSPLMQKLMGMKTNEETDEYKVIKIRKIEEE
ncbi:MAG: GreA/GreB family elongation factor [bacterium]|nr:GreA/GreB family elongation factor [bacterium]